MLITKQELQIVSEFRKNARENLTTASRRLRIPVSTLYDRLKRYQGNLIKKHTALLDFGKLGFSLRMIMTFKCEVAKRDQVKSFLETHHRVNTVYKLGNGSDFMVEVLFKDLKEANLFTESMEEFNIKEKQEYYIVEDIKREAFLTDDLAIDIIADE